MIHAVKSLCQTAENSSNMQFLINRFEYTILFLHHHHQYQKD